jgi:putative spermidine/putrescine transport system substrate-binding protein
MKFWSVPGAVLAAALIFLPAHHALARHEPPRTEEPAEEKPATPAATPETTQAAKPEASPPATQKATPATPPEATPAASQPSAPPASLKVASWGGAYMESQRRAYFTPFQDETGIAIEEFNHKGALKLLTDENTSQKPDWDLVDLELAVLERACAQGKLEKVNLSDLAAAGDETSAADDFLPGTLHDCGIPSVAWSSAIVFDTGAFKKAKPATAKDFFDTKSFPGKRALPRGPKYIFELALMADGVEPQDVYPTLATQEGALRALKMLERLRGNIIWWDRGKEPLQALASGEATMAIAFNGRIFNAIVAQNRPYDVIWDGQVFDLDMWAIPKGTPHKSSALKFIAFATRPDRLAAQARLFPYGPVRKSALKLIGKHPEVDANMSDYIPTSRKNFKRALRMDASWWEEHGAEMKERIKIWRIGAGGSAESGSDAERENAS